jgi:hypothetical protein
MTVEEGRQLLPSCDVLGGHRQLGQWLVLPQAVPAGTRGNGTSWHVVARRGTSWHVAARRGQAPPATLCSEIMKRPSTVRALTSDE